MTTSKITINGREYDSPESMPPDVRCMYEAALRAAGPVLASGEGGESTQVFTSPPGRGGLVVNGTVVVKNRTYKSVDEMPPDARKLYEAALGAPEAAGVSPVRPGFHLSVKMSRPQVRSIDDSSTAPTPSPLPIEPSSTEAKIRGFVWTLAYFVLGVLALLFFWPR